MPELIVSWPNATRTRLERTQIELTARNDLLDFFNGVENAARAHNQHYAAHQHPQTDWARATRAAFAHAAKDLTPCERNGMCMVAEFRFP